MITTHPFCFSEDPLSSRKDAAHRFVVFATKEGGMAGMVAVCDSVRPVRKVGHVVPRYREEMVGGRKECGGGWGERQTKLKC